MILKAILFSFVLIGSVVSDVAAQTHLTYGDTSGPFIDLSTERTITNSESDTRVIMGFAEHFILPSGQATLDSVDFFIDSIGADSNIIDVVPDTAIVTGNGTEVLPNFINPNLIKIFRFSKESVKSNHVSISCGKINIPNSFFIYLTNGLEPKGNSYRGTLRTETINLDTARAAFVALDTLPPPKLVEGLVDENLVASGLNVDLDIGITYENAEGVKIHTSPSKNNILFPNPVRIGNLIHLNDSNSFVSIEVVDEAGRIARTIHGDVNSTLSEFSTQGLPAGVYNAILFFSEDTGINVRFIIE